MRSKFTFLDDSISLFSHWSKIVIEHDVRGKLAHDARLVAAMHSHGINELLTNNVQDFQRFPGIRIHTPRTAS